MTHNEASGQSTEELTERAVQAIARVWGVSEDEARAAIIRAAVTTNAVSSRNVGLSLST